jgi:hypothetical protein
MTAVLLPILKPLRHLWQRESIAVCKEISFHFKGGFAANHTLPVDYMINLLEGVRDLTYLTIAQQEGSVFNERFRPSKQIKDSVVVMCKPAEAGSFSQTLEFECVGEKLLPRFEPETICGKIKNFLIDLAQNANDKIVQTFPHVKMRIRALESVKKALPPSDSTLYVEVDDDPAINSKTIHAHCSAMADAARSVAEDYMTVVTGRLIRIDFEQKKLVIQHPVTRKLLDCFYNEEVESMLLENRRELIQVTGNVVMDDNDLPKEISDVVCIQEVDITPIELDDIPNNDHTLRFKEPTILTPVLDDSQQLFVVKDAHLGLDIFAYTRAEIIGDAKSEIAFLWNEYALAQDEDLTANALMLKKNLLSLLEVSNG